MVCAHILRANSIEVNNKVIEMFYKGYTIEKDRYPERCHAFPTEDGADESNQLNGTVEQIKSEIDDILANNA